MPQFSVEWASELHPPDLTIEEDQVNIVHRHSSTILQISSNDKTYLYINIQYNSIIHILYLNVLILVDPMFLTFSTSILECFDGLQCHGDSGIHTGWIMANQGQNQPTEANLCIAGGILGEQPALLHLNF